jgi:hypothetical protein
MRKRASIEKAQWTENREDFYKKECFNLAFDHNNELVVENQTL